MSLRTHHHHLSINYFHITLVSYARRLYQPLLYTSTAVDNKYRALRCQVNFVEKDDGAFMTVRDHVLDSQVKSRDIEVLNVYAVKREVRTKELFNNPLREESKR